MSDPVNESTSQREALIEKLTKHFGMNDKDGTYWYVLTRVKEARHVGTLTIYDFREIDEELIAEIADVLLAETTLEPTSDDVEDLARELYNAFNKDDSGKYDSIAMSDFFREPFRNAARTVLAAYTLTPRKAS